MAIDQYRIACIIGLHFRPGLSMVAEEKIYYQLISGIEMIVAK